MYRGGDSLGSLAFDGLTRLGLGMSGIAFVAVPIAGVWGLIGLWLGKKQSRMVASAAPTPVEEA